VTLQEVIVTVAAAFLVLLLIGGATIVTSAKKEFAGHPKGLYVLFFAEMWERFSYYGMRAILIFYLTQHWLFSDGKSALIFGAYTSLVYITPVLGGYLADRYLGQRKAVLFGGVLLALGHGFMAVEGTGGQDDPAINVFWLALASSFSPRCSPVCGSGSAARGANRRRRPNSGWPLRRWALPTSFSFGGPRLLASRQ
jgi:POT family proton-dependent oligopeptide transporter